MSATGVQLGVDRAFERVVETLERQRCAWVTGDVGSGRATLARRLAEHYAADEGRAAWVDLLDLRQADAIIGGLFGAAAWLADPAARKACLRDWSSVREGTQAFAAKAGDDFTLIVTVPLTWSLQARAEDDALGYTVARRAGAFLRSLTSLSQQVVLITTRSMRPEAAGLDDVAPIRLPRARNALALLVTRDWGRYAAAAEALKTTVDDDLDPSPLALRLAVGAAGLGSDVATLAGWLERPAAEALSIIADEIVNRLNRPDLATVRGAVQRQLLARRPLPRGELAATTGIEDEHVPLLTECIGYGEDSVRVSTAARRRLVQHLFTGDTEEQEAERVEDHRALAAHYERLDGKPEITETSGGGTTAWLERMHHLAFVEPENVRHLPCRELYWERGRALSKHREEWAAAVTVYRQCTERFPDDGYAWHYLGFNMERAGLDRRETEAAYRKAIALDPDNPWWNRRLVTFLVGQGKPRAARRAWHEAVNHVDPDGERAAESPWLGEHFHLPVCRAWLEVGSVADAFEVLQGLGEGEVLHSSMRLQRLREQVLDAVEADALGDSVYPPWVPASKRWTLPMALPSEVAGQALRKWFPGRVLEAGPKGVTIFYGDRLDGEYRPMVTWIDDEEWRRIGYDNPQPGKDFVFLGVYGRGEVRRVVLQNWPKELEGEAEPASRELPLAYFDRWSSQP